MIMFFVPDAVSAHSLPLSWRVSERSQWRMRLPRISSCIFIWFWNPWNTFHTLLVNKQRQSRTDWDLHWQIIRWRWVVIGSSCLAKIILSAVCIRKLSFLSSLKNKLLMRWFFSKKVTPNAAPFGKQGQCLAAGLWAWVSFHLKSTVSAGK